MLMPASLQDWLGPKHLARFVVDCVEAMNLTRIEASYAGRGERAYRPKMLIALLFYGYATGVFSSRKLERACFDSVVFRYIAACTPHACPRQTFMPRAFLSVGVRRREAYMPHETCEIVTGKCS